MSDSPALSCRQLIRSLDRASLATKLKNTDAEPYVSLVLSACDYAGNPLIFVSDLAEHTANLTEEPRVSLLFDGTRGRIDPLTGARISVQGRAEKIDNDHAMERYIRRHPSAAMYRSFADFNLYRVNVERVHLVAGFGRIHWVGADDVLYDAADAGALADAEADVIAHMNEDHGDAVNLYANRLLGLAGVGWQLTGVDPEGCDLRLDGEVARLDFDTPVTDAEGARRELVKRVKEARAAA